MDFGHTRGSEVHDVRGVSASASRADPSPDICRGIREDKDRIGDPPNERGDPSYRASTAYAASRVTNVPTRLGNVHEHEFVSQDHRGEQFRRKRQPDYVQTSGAVQQQMIVNVRFNVRCGTPGNSNSSPAPRPLADSPDLRPTMVQTCRPYLEPPIVNLSHTQL